MRIPGLGTTRRKIAALLMVGAVGFCAWFFLLRDAGVVMPTERADRKGERSGPISDDRIVRKLSTSERVDQVLMLGFEGANGGAPFVAKLRERQLGGVLVRGQNWTDSGAGQALVAALARAGRTGDRVPPLIAASQEGGVYRSFPDLPPAARALDIGRIRSPERARGWANEAARALRSVGFHLNLFPVADIATLDSPLAGRAFSDDAGQVASLTKAALGGCEAAKLACAPLHFPGLGAASQDTAEGPATVSLDAGSLTARDLEPFRAAVAGKAPAMVLSLALYPAFDSVVPAALAPQVATELLRGEVGFRGVAISDDLASGAVKATYKVPEAAVAALGAGVDLIQVSSPEDQDGVAKALRDAVESGEVPAERLAQAAERVLDLKRDLGLIK